jgi:hypothetical protein
LELIPEIASLEEFFPRGQLNITYLPLTAPPPVEASAEWVLEHYNYARARVLLRALPGVHRNGPYIVSVLQPLSGVGVLSGKYLYQDMSSVPPDLVLLWVKEFLNQAAQERFWEEDTARQFVLKLRTNIGRAAKAWPHVQAAIVTLIFWRR